MLYVLIFCIFIWQFTFCISTKRGPTERSLPEYLPVVPDHLEPYTIYDIRYTKYKIRMRYTKYNIRNAIYEIRNTKYFNT